MKGSESGCVVVGEKTTLQFESENIKPAISRPLDMAIGRASGTVH